MHDDQSTSVRASAPRARRRVGLQQFSTADVSKRYHERLEEAQTYFLQRKFQQASVAAAEASKILPTSHIFSLLAAISEGMGHFDRANDFRLLQAFLAKDPALWRELLLDFLQDQQFFKATVCLQRLSALESKDASRYRSLQIQLADLYAGIGEVRRASLILTNLWTDSRYRDFEVFAALSSLHFQLGRWSSLNTLIQESVSHGFRRGAGSSSGAGSSQSQLPSGGTTTTTLSQQRRTSKRVRFMDELMTDDGREVETVATATTTSTTPTTMTSTVAEADDFSFGDESDSSSPRIESNTKHTTTATTAAVDSDMDDAYTNMDLSTPNAKRNFLTLINVQGELFNEQGQFERTLMLTQRAAALLNVPLLELPPDLLLRYAVAAGYLDMHQTCIEVVECLLMTCPMDQYGDALYDAAVTLQNVGLHEEALRVLAALQRYHRLMISDILMELVDEEGNATDGESEPMERGRLEASVFRNVAMEKWKHTRDGEIKNLRTTDAAITFHIGKSLASLHRDDEARTALEEVLEIDEHHVDSRVELSALLMRSGGPGGNLEAAIELLFPKDGDDAFQIVMLSASLLPLLFKQGKYVEAIGIGVGIFQLLLNDKSGEEGDRMSTASGGTNASTRSRRAREGYSMPKLTRSTSALVSTSSLMEAIQGQMLSSGGDSVISGLQGGRAPTALTSSQSIAASFRSVASPQSAVAVSRRGSLTATVAGSMAAESVAGGASAMSSASGAFNKKDASLLFSFHRRQRGGGDGGVIVSAKNAQLNQRKELLQREAERRRREFDALHAEVDSDGASVGDVADLEEMERLLHDSETTGGDDAEDLELLSMDDAPEKNEENLLTENNSVIAERCQMEETSVVKEGNAEPRRKRARVENAVSGTEVPMSLDEVAKNCFHSDPAMAALFLQATSEVTTTTATAAGAAHAAPMPPPPQPIRPPAPHEVVKMVGVTRLVQLAVLIVDAYVLLEMFVEAKEFAFIVLTRLSEQLKRREFLLDPIRFALLRCAVESGQAEDVSRIALSMLSRTAGTNSSGNSTGSSGGVIQRSDASLSASCPNEVWQAIAALTVHPSAASSSASLLLRHLVDRGRMDVPVLCILGNRYLQHGTTRLALNCFLVALSLRPQDLYLNFLVGALFCMTTSSRVVAVKHECVSAGLHYFQNYANAVLDKTSDVMNATAFSSREENGVWGVFCGSTKQHTTSSSPSKQHDQPGMTLLPSSSGLRETKYLEILYNSGRLFQFLELVHLAVPLYDRCVQEARRLRAAAGGGSSSSDGVVFSEATKLLEAATCNLYLIYSRRTNNMAMAMSSLAHVSELSRLQQLQQQ